MEIYALELQGAVPWPAFHPCKTPRFSLSYLGILTTLRLHCGRAMMALDPDEFIPPPLHPTAHTAHTKDHRLKDASPMYFSVPLPRRLRTRTPRQTPIISPPRPQKFLRRQLQFPIQTPAWLFAVYEVAEPTPHAALPAVEPTTRFSEVGHGGQFAVDGPRGVPARIERVAGFLGGVFVFEARVDVADEICSP